MISIGLTGGFLSGKTTVSQMLKEKGAVVLDADKVGHQLYLPGTPIYHEVVAAFGKGILNEKQEVDRKKLGAIVFSDRAALEKLNLITHPAIYKTLMGMVDAERAKDTRVVVVEAALMLEARWEALANQIWVVVASEETVLQRINNRPGLTAEQAKARVRSQMSNEDRIERSEVVVRTDCSLAEVQAQVDKLWEGLDPDHPGTPKALGMPAAKGPQGSRSPQPSSVRTIYKEHLIEEYASLEEPFYIPVGDEVKVFEAAYDQKIPVLLKGPTGCGKTRFVQYMAWKLGRPISIVKGPEDEVQRGLPLVTVACHEDLTASDLVGRYLLEGESTRWIDGPLTRAVKAGAICYLDEIVEARKDTTVLIHPLTDHRRILPIEKKGQILEACDGFLLVISYNPGYQSALKDLKHSTRQRFIAIEFDYPPRDVEKMVVMHESGVDEGTAEDLAKLGEKVRHLKEHGLQEGVSTRLLIYAGALMRQGIPARRACQVAVVWSLTDDLEIQKSVEEVVSAIFP